MSLVLLRGVSAAGAAALRGWSCLGSNVAAAAAAARGSLHKSPLLQTARDYARPVRRKKQEIPSHLDDLPPTMLKKPYANIPVIDKVDDVVRRLLSLEMASQKEKVKIKKQQLADQVRKSPTDTSSLEVQVAFLTAKIRTLQEHLHMHTKDTVNRRQMLIAIDRPGPQLWAVEKGSRLATLLLPAQSKTYCSFWKPAAKVPFMKCGKPILPPTFAFNHEHHASSGTSEGQHRIRPFLQFVERSALGGSPGLFIIHLQVPAENVLFQPGLGVTDIRYPFKCVLCMEGELSGSFLIFLIYFVFLSCIFTL